MSFTLYRILSSALTEFDLVGAIIPSVENENETVPPTIDSINSMTNAQLEELTKEWMRPIQKVLLTYKQMEPIDDSPIGEFESWRMQGNEYGILLENMRHPFVVAVQRKFVFDAANNTHNKMLLNSSKTRR